MCVEAASAGESSLPAMCTYFFLRLLLSDGRWSIPFLSWFLLLLIPISTWSATGHGQELCPISASFVQSQSQTKGMMNASRPDKPAVLHNYPLDIFSRSQLARTIVYNRSSIMWCRASDSTESSSKHTTMNKVTNRLHTCSPLTYCPILPQNIITAQKATTAIPSWKVYSSFCSFKQHLHSLHQRVNIIILGGSVTLGVGSTGCCCSRSHDKRCPYPQNTHRECEHVKRTSRTSFPIPVHYCTWHGYLHRYLQTNFPASHNIHLINLAKGGVSSGSCYPTISSISLFCHPSYVKVYTCLISSKQTLYEQSTTDQVGDEDSPYEVSAALKEHGIVKLRSSDMVFLDYSVNDGRTADSDSQLAGGLDRLVRRLFLLR